MKFINNNKKGLFITIVSIIVLVGSIITINYSRAFAPYWEEEGTSSDPYIIENYDDFSAIFISMIEGQNYVGKYFKQISDIVITDEVMNGNTFQYQFNGVYDGCGHVIKNINIEANNTGLFGAITENGVVKNFGLLGGNITVSGGSYFGSITRRIGEGGRLENCFSTANITVTNTTTRVSGLVGYMDGTGATVINSYYGGTITGPTGHNAYNGIAFLSTTTTVGGINMYVTNSYYLNQSSITGALNDITNGSATNVESYETTNIEDNTLNNKLNFYLTLGLHNDNYWKVDNSNVVFDTNVSVKESFNGTGTENDPYQITTFPEFVSLINLIKNYNTLYPNFDILKGVYFKQMNDLDFSGDTLSGSQVGDRFAGIYDGDGHVINNISITGVSPAVFGFLVANGTIKNFGLVGGTITSTSGAQVSSLARKVDGGIIENCFSTATIQSNASDTAVSGLVAFIEKSGGIYNSYFNGVLTGGSKHYGIGNGNVKSGGTIVIDHVYSPDEYSQTADAISSTVIDSNVLSRETLNSSTLVDYLNNYAKYTDYAYKWKLDTVVKFDSQLYSGVILEGDGTSANPYVVNDIDDIKSLMKSISINGVNKHFLENKYVIQTANIVYTDSTPITGLGSNVTFSGTYDGQGHYIKNLLLSGNGVGLFGNVENGTIKNFGLLGGTLTTLNTSYFGTLARRLYNSSIINCYSSMNIVATGASQIVSGLVGFIDSVGTIKNSVYAGTISNTSNAYGIAYSRGTSNEIITNSYALNSNAKISESKKITSSELVDETTMKSSTVLIKLNEFVNNDDSLNYHWINESETGYPILESTSRVNNKINSLTIDGYSTNDDSASNDIVNWYADNGEYYLFMPKLMTRNHIKVSFTGNNDITIVVKDMSGNLLGTIENNSYTDLLTNDKVIFVATSATGADSEYIVNIMQSTISSIFISIDGGDDSLSSINADPVHEVGFTGSAVIADEKNNVSIATIKKIKGRGNTTWTHVKKPYQIKFDDKISMLGMKKSKTWLIITGYMDGTLSRSYLWYQFTQDIGLQYGIEMKPADIYINNKYQGSYLVTSKVEVDKNRVNVGDNDYLLEIDNSVDTYQINTSKGYTITIKNPDLEESTTDTISTVKKDVKSTLDLIESKIYDQSVTLDEIGNYINIDSFAKFYLIQELAENYDAMVGSCYMYLKDGIIYMGPIWDMDNTLNRSYSFSVNTGYYILDDSGINSRMKANWFKELFKRVEFANIVDKLILDNIDTISSLPDKLTTYVNTIKDSASMNYIRWPYANMISNQTKTWITGNTDFDSAVNILKNSLQERVNWYLSEYDELVFDKYVYEVYDVSSNIITNEITNNSIVLPPNVNLNSTIKFFGYRNGTKYEIGSDTLVNGSLTKTITVSQTTSSSNKTTNNLIIDYQVNVAQMNYLEIETPPNKVVYVEGDTFDRTGMVVNLVYSDGYKKTITDYTIDKETLNINDDSVTISYNNISTNLTITVNPNVVESIKIVTNPLKTKYIEGDTFNKNGLIVSAIYTNNSEIVINDYTIDKDVLSLTDTEVTISYQEKTVKLPITVIANVIETIKITKEPKRVQYVEGESFDSTGMIVKTIYTNGLEQEITDYTINKSKLTIDDKEIVITYNNLSTTLYINVVVNNLVGIEITHEPNKVNYIEGEKFNKDGLVVIAKYKDGSSKEITDYSYTKEISLNDKYVVISYGDQIVSQNITVTKKEIVKIEIKQKPNKTSYFAGDTFDSTGMIVKAYYNNGLWETINNYEVTSSNPLDINDTDVTVKYLDYKTTQSIIVKNIELLRLEITNKPNKLEYYENESFSKEGLVVTAIYNNGTKKVISDYKIDKDVLDLSDTEVTISYENISVKQEIKVYSVSHNDNLLSILVVVLSLLILSVVSIFIYRKVKN